MEEGGDDEDVARARKKQKIGPQKPADKDRAKPRPELKLREAEVCLRKSLRLLFLSQGFTRAVGLT